MFPVFLPVARQECAGRTSGVSCTRFVGLVVDEPVWLGSARLGSARLGSARSTEHADNGLVPRSPHVAPRRFAPGRRFVACRAL